jgi:hypothetical protein
MAEKISINIDLRNLQSEFMEVNNEAPKEYRYRYDRIYTFVFMFVLFFFTIYFISTSEQFNQASSKQSIIKKVPETINKKLPPQRISIPPPLLKAIVKEKHLTIESQVIPDIRPKKQTIFLYSESINIMEIFLHETSVKKTVEKNKEKISSEKADTTVVTENKNHFIQIFSNDLSRVVLSEGIYKKEPVNELSSTVTGTQEKAKKVYIFTQWDNNKRKVIEHQWWYQGKLLSRKKFIALGNRWRCYSSKNIDKFHQGDWTIKIVDTSGKMLSSIKFHYKLSKTGKIEKNVIY